MPANILVVDDELSMREFLQILLEKEGYRVVTTGGGKSAINLFEKSDFDMVISDIRMPDMDGLEVLKAVKEISPDVAVLMITAFASMETAVHAMKLGAFDYITKPFKVDEIRYVIKNALERQSLHRENILLKKELKTRYGFANIIGSHERMIEIYDLIQRIAPSRANVLVLGESGTGKELVAKAIHYNSPRKDAPFVTINCGAIPETLLESELFGHKKGSFTGAISNKLGLFSAANTGTIFLDEIGDVPLSIQVKLLRVLQEKTIRPVGGLEDLPVDVRIIAASNHDLTQEVIKGTFREDLFYRLNVITIEMPPLKERRSDIPILANYFLEKYNKELGKSIQKVSSEAMHLLEQYDYPGNVRELENFIERAVALEITNVVLPESLPPHVFKTSLSKEIIPSLSNISFNVNPAPSLDSNYNGGQPIFKLQISPEGIDLEQILEKIEKSLILQALEKAGGVKKKAAKYLGISFRSFRYRLMKYYMDIGIDDEEE